MENEKRVVLTTCFLDNYGACLQAYALQTVLRNFGLDCKILRYLEPSGYAKASSFRDILLDNELTYLIRACLKKSYRGEYLRHFKFKKFRKNHLYFYPGSFYSYEQVREHCFKNDILMCGSDQIWNPSFYNKCNRVYMLDFGERDALKVAYAPSIGLSEMPVEYCREFERMVNRLDYISVREKTGKRIIEMYTDKEIVVCPDPTFLLNKAEWKKLINKEKKFEIESNYIFCYFFGHNDGLYKSAIEKYKKELDCRAIIVPFYDEHRHLGCEAIDDTGPIDFIWYILNAKLVLTDSFHATAFSLNFNTPFYSFLRNSPKDRYSMNSRIQDILDECGLQGRLIVKEGEITDGLRVDFKYANSILKEKRKTGIDFLKQALQL